MWYNDGNQRERLIHQKNKSHLVINKWLRQDNDGSR